jgi:nucleoside-diphosphate-sugar epimerase
MTPDNRQILLVTGGSGYIGSSLVEKALRSGYAVRVLDNTKPTDDSIQSLFANPSVRFFKGSITDSQALTESISGVDYIIHLAGVSDGRAGKENPELTRRVNIDSIEQLLSISKQAGVKKFIFASTMGVYGNRYDTALHEELPLNPVDPYSESKAIGESYVSRTNGPGFCTVSLRIAMVYGVGPKVREDFLVNKLCITAINNGRIRITGGSQKRPQIHIDDLTDLFLKLLSGSTREMCGQVFNAVGSNPSLKEIVNSIVSSLPQTRVEYLPARPDEDSFEMSGDKLAEKLRFRPAKSLDKGIAEIIQHYIQAAKLADRV